VRRTWENLLQIPGCSPAIVAYALEIYNGNTSLAALFLQNGTVSSIPAWRSQDDSLIEATETELVERYGLDLINDRRHYLSEKVRR